MKKKRKARKPRPDPLDQALFQIELRIARRADELARLGQFVPGRDFEYWLRAEREVLAP